MSKGDKYSELEQYLKNCNKDMVCLSFEQIEQILGFSLPASAKRYSAWWANDTTHSQGISWINAGYKTKYCDFINKKVNFQQQDIE